MQQHGRGHEIHANNEKELSSQPKKGARNSRENPTLSEGIFHWEEVIFSAASSMLRRFAIANTTSHFTRSREVA
jgi:hypothetical protein